MSPDEPQVLEFLTSLFTAGESYSGINSARSALSTFLANEKGTTIGNFPSVKRFLKGVFTLRPPIARYNNIWDVNIVLEYIKKIYPYEGMPLYLLTYKLVMLLALTSAQRVQTLHVLNIEEFVVEEEFIKIPIHDLLKQTSARKYKFSIELHRYQEDPSLCVVSSLREYLCRTRNLRGSEKYLLISFKKPYKRVTKQTISRWLNKVMFEAGIDIDTFKPHSTRAAAVSKAKQELVPVDDILQVAGWANETCFKRFYDKAIIRDNIC